MLQTAAATKTILVVDDSASVRQQLSFVLQQAGYRVVEAFDGEHALALLQRINVQLILCDVNMPRMNGLELIERLKLRTSLTPCLMLTIERHGTLLDRARRAGATGWIIKPFKAEQLIKAIAKLVGD